MHGVGLGSILASVLFTPFAFANSDLSLSKAVDDPRPFVGQEITFTITVENDGPQDGLQVQVTDRLAAGFTYARDTSGGDYDLDTGVLSERAS